MKYKALPLLTAAAFASAAFIGVHADAGVIAGGYDYTTIDVPGLTNASVGGINDNGLLVGTGSNAGVLKGWTLSGGTFTIVDAPAGQTFLTFGGVNNAGTIVGGAKGTDNIVRGFIKTSSTFAYTQYNATSPTTRFDSINDGGDRVGYVDQTGADRDGLLQTADGSFLFVNPPDSTRTFAIGINNVGQIVGSKRVGTRNFGFVRNAAGIYAQLDYPGSTNTSARAINDGGVIVGTMTGVADAASYVYANGNYTPLSFPGASSIFVNDINNAGVIAGQYTDASGGFHGFTASAVPEPASLGLFALGGAALLRRRRSMR